METVVERHAAKRAGAEARRIPLKKDDKTVWPRQM